MKIKGILAATLLFLVAASAQASTVLMPTSGDVNVFIDANLLGSVQPGYSLAIFDDSVTMSTQMSTAGRLDIASNQVITIAASGSDYLAEAIDPAGQLTLTGSSQFILGLFDGTNWMMDSGLGSVSLGANSVQIAFDGPNSVFLVDVAVSAVPIPAAVWLFGAGLIGLAGIARRRS